MASLYYGRPAKRERSMRILGLETSCDETGVAVYDSERGLLAHALYRQIELHAEYVRFQPIAFYGRIGRKQREIRMSDKKLCAAFAIAGLSSLLKSPLYAGFWVSGYFIYLFIF